MIPRPWPAPLPCPHHEAGAAAEYGTPPGDALAASTDDRRKGHGRSRNSRAGAGGARGGGRRTRPAGMGSTGRHHRPDMRAVLSGGARGRGGARRRHAGPGKSRQPGRVPGPPGSQRCRIRFRVPPVASRSAHAAARPGSWPVSASTIRAAALDCGDYASISRSRLPLWFVSSICSPAPSPGNLGHHSREPGGIGVSGR